MDAERPWLFRTERLGFRHWREDDLPLAIALWGDPEVSRFFGGPFSEEGCRERLEREIANNKEGGIQYWPMFLLSTGEHVGCCGLRPRAGDGIYAMGFHLRPEFWGAGYGFEAAQRVITLAFETLGATALFAGRHPDNESSHRLLTRLGFQYTHDELYPPTGRMHRSYRLQRDERGSDQ
jgi:[ribosomal protein S5]-alanine N-acetyltransferase